MSSANGRPDILTVSGEFFDFLEPERNHFDIEVIAHHLSNLCRFCGAVSSFYSVAQHCVLVSRLVPPDLALVGLLHDAAEAFVGDVAKPLKRLLPDYQVIEQRVETAVLARFGLSLPYPAAVHQADRQALAIEQYWLMPRTREWTVDGFPYPSKYGLEAMPPVEARAAFLNRYTELNAVRPAS